MNAFKRTVSFLLVLVVVLGLVPQVSATSVLDSGECGTDGDNVIWTLYSNGLLELTGSGAMEDFDYLERHNPGAYESTAPWFDYHPKYEFTSVKVGDGITNVGSNAFRDCDSLTSVSIGSDVVTIGEYAFNNCMELRSVALPDSVRTVGEGAFGFCMAMATLDLGSGITTIGDYAFERCDVLTELVIPNSVTSLGRSAFENCGVTELQIGTGLTTLPYSVFWRMTKLKSVTIPGNVKTIGDSAFGGCTSLKDITLSQGIQTLGNSSFSNCAVEAITLPSSVTSVGSYAFSDCTSLSIATFQGNAPAFGTDVFDGCDSELTIYYSSAATGWSTPEWNGYPALPYDARGALPQTWPVNNGAHVITVVDANVGSSGEVFPIVGATVKIRTKGGTIKTGTTDANGQFAYYGSDGLELRIEADGYQIRRSAYVMKTGESRLFALEPLSSDGAPYFSMLSARAHTDDGLCSVDLRTDAVSYVEGDNTGMQLLFEVAVDESIIALDSVELMQYPVDLEHDGKYMRFMYTGTPNEFHIEDGTFGHNLYKIVPGKFRSQEQIYAVIHYRIKGGDSTLYSTDPIPLSLNIIPLPQTISSAEDNTVDLTPGTTDSGRLSWLKQILVSIEHPLFTTFLGDPSVESELLNFSYAVETDSKTGNRKLRFTIGLTESSNTYNLLTEEITETKDDTTYQLLRDWINSKELKKGKPLDFLSSKVGEKVKDEFKKTRVKAVGELGTEILGYYEAELDSNGNIIPDTSKGRILVNATAKATQGKTAIIYGFPLYYEAVVAAEFATTMAPRLCFNPLLNQVTLTPEMEEFSLTLPKVSLEGGIGIRGVATTGVGGVFENTITTTLSATESTTRIVGSTNAYFRIYIAYLLDYKDNFGSKNGGKVILYDTTDISSGNSVSLVTGRSLIQQALAEPELTLSQRSYLQNTTQWNGNPIQLMTSDPVVTLQNGVLPNAMPQLHTLGDRQILLFLADDAASALGSHTRLMYSVRENGVWSEPAAVWESDTGDLYFDSAVINGQLWVTWQKSRGSVTGEDAMSMLSSLSSQSEICLALWDDAANGFTGQQYLTDNSRLDMMASLCAAEDGVQVTWVSNDENNALGTGGTYTIHTLSVADGVPGAVSDLYATDNYVTELTTAAGSDGLQVLFATLDEENRTDLNLLGPDGLTTPVTDGTYAGLSTENGRFLWQSDGTLWRYSPSLNQYEAMIAPENGGVSSSFRYVTNGEWDAVVWSEGQEPCRILASVLTDGQWSEPIVLVEDIQQTVTFLDAALTSDGSFVLVLNTADLTGGDDSVTALKTAVITPACDVAVRSTSVERVDPDGNAQAVTLVVENPGLVAVDALHLTATGGDLVLLDQEYPVELAPGGACTITAQFDVSGISALTQVDIQVQADADANPTDNHASVTVGHTDTALTLDVQELGDHLIFLLNVSNDSNVPTDARIRVLAGSLDGEEAACLEVGTVVLGEHVQYLYTLDKRTVDFGDEDYIHYLFSLETTETDWDLSDNVCAYRVEKPSDGETPTEAAGEELVMIQPDGVQIQNGDIHFSSPNAEPVLLTAVITPEDSSITEVYWSVADPEIACVLSDGTLLPGSAGTTTVTAALDHELFDTITVTVSEAVEAHIHTTALIPGTDATCTDQGWTDGSCCRDCGEILTEQEPIAPLGHTWKGLRCSRCTATRSNPFVDVPENSFYIDPVLWAVEKGITTGATATTFDPNGKCLRASVVTFLWRAAGCPEPSITENPFTDVKQSDFFYKAVLWAVSEGITNGTTQTTFSPYVECNRATVVTFLYRALGEPEVASTENPFSDVVADTWYGPAVLWAVSEGITNGMSSNSFGVTIICNRAQVVTFLYRAFHGA